MPIPKVSRGLRVLSPVQANNDDIPTQEYSKLLEEAADIETWWKDPRWQHTTRVYKGEKKEEENISIHTYTNIHTRWIQEDDRDSKNNCYEKWNKPSYYCIG